MRSEAHNNLGIGLGALGKFDEAIDEFEYALRLKPDFEDARVNLAMTQRARQQSKRR